MAWRLRCWPFPRCAGFEVRVPQTRRCCVRCVWRLAWLAIGGVTIVTLGNLRLTPATLSAIDSLMGSSLEVGALSHLGQGDRGVGRHRLGGARLDAR